MFRSILDVSLINFVADFLRRGDAPKAVPDLSSLPEGEQARSSCDSRWWIQHSSAEKSFVLIKSPEIGFLPVDYSADVDETTYGLELNPRGMSVPKSTAAWTVNGQCGIDALKFVEGFPVPTVQDDEVLVKIFAVSLNYRDIVVVKGDFGDVKNGLVPGSDGSGIVQAIGSKVTEFAVGDRVCTHLTCELAEDEFPGWKDIVNGLGHTTNGTLRQYGVFHKTSLVKMPPSLNFLQAATLTCSGLTAWNALFGLDGKGPGVGSTVLVQGSGGVSIAALQFAIATGATVIATTSSYEKANRLESLGAKYVVNYRETSNWGEATKSDMTNGKGVDVVVDVGGPSTLQQSLQAVKRNGVISASGLLGESPDGKVPTILDCIFAACIARGILLGSRKQFKDMNNFIEEFGIKPVLDEKVFEFDEMKEAFKFMSEQRHFSKVVIRVAESQC